MKYNLITYEYKTNYIYDLHIDIFELYAKDNFVYDKFDPNILNQDKKPKVFAPKKCRLAVSDKYVRSSSPELADFILLDDSFFDSIKWNYFYLLPNIFVQNNFVANDGRCMSINQYKFNIDVKNFDANLDTYSDYNNPLLNWYAQTNEYPENVNLGAKIDFDTCGKKIYKMTEFINHINESGLVIDEDKAESIKRRIKSCSSAQDYVFIVNILQSCNIKKSAMQIAVIMDEYYAKMKNELRGTQWSSKLRELMTLLTGNSDPWSGNVYKLICEKYELHTNDEAIMQIANSVVLLYKEPIRQRLSGRYLKEDVDKMMEYIEKNNRSLRGEYKDNYIY